MWRNVGIDPLKCCPSKVVQTTNQNSKKSKGKYMKECRNVVHQKFQNSEKSKENTWRNVGMLCIKSSKILKIKTKYVKECWNWPVEMLSISCPSLATSGHIGLKLAHFIFIKLVYIFFYIFIYEFYFRLQAFGIYPWPLSVLFLFFHS